MQEDEDEGIEKEEKKNQNETHEDEEKKEKKVMMKREDFKTYVGRCKEMTKTKREPTKKYMCTEGCVPGLRLGVG